MSHELLYFLDGTTFFVGLLVSALSLGLRLVAHKRWLVRLLNLVAIVGLILVILSAIPLPIWAYLLWCGFVLALLFLPVRRNEQGGRAPLFVYLACVATTLGLFLMELPHHRMPTITVEKDATVYIVGDSLSAGIGGEKETWPTIFARQSGHKVVNLAVPGATTKTAMRQVASIPEDESAMVFVEIGGNDLLGGEKGDFHADLDRLLSELTKKKCRVVLFELPLPPFYNGYGKTQRELAGKYHATLIPKRYLAQALCTSGGTLDGLHLSESGHQVLAEAMSRFFYPK